MPKVNNAEARRSPRKHRSSTKPKPKTDTFVLVVKPEDGTNMRMELQLGPHNELLNVDAVLDKQDVEVLALNWTPQRNTQVTVKTPGAPTKVLRYTPDAPAC